MHDKEIIYPQMQFQGSYIRWNKDMYISGGDLEQTKMIPSIHLTDRCFYIPISIINRETLFRWSIG